MTRALDGITVIDMTDGMAGAMSTMFLCDNGAGVVCIDDAAGAARHKAPGYMVWDRGKQSIFLDLSSGRESADIASFDSLIKSADVLVETLPPSSTLQSVVDYDRLSSINPRLVHCSITAYGKTGPLKDEPPIDDLVMARTGILANQPGVRPGPTHVIHPVPSVGAALLAAQGVVASLYAREKDGRGRKVDTSLMAGAFLFAPKVIGEVFKENPKQAKPGGDAPFYSIFECADGGWVQLGCVRKGFIDSAAEVMGIAEALADPKFGDGFRGLPEENREELYGIVAEAMKTRPSEEWARLFDEADVPHALARTTDEALDDPQVLFNEMLIELDDPASGRVSQMGVPIQLSETPGAITGPRPTPGQHTKEVLSGLSGERSPPDAHEPAGPGVFDPPLKGIRVLEMTNLIAGPIAGKLLADLGAEVTKLEPLQGDISRGLGRSYFVFLNNNKRSVCFDTRTPEGKEVAQKLTARADILLANLRPGATDRMGIGTDALAQLNPNIIETHVTGYGWTGPYAHRPGMDPVATAWMGLQLAQGGKANRPVFLGQLAVSDFAAGAMGTLGALMALFVRERTGRPQRVNTNLLSGGIILSSEDFTRYDGKPPRRLADEDLYGLGALHCLYETRDGWIYLVAESEDEWQALCGGLGRDDMLEDTRFASVAARRRNDADLADELASVFETASSDHWLEQLREAGVACAPVTEGSDWFFDDPDAADNDLIAQQQHSVIGRVKLFHNGIRFAHTANVYPITTPILGEHMRETLAELGYAESQIQELYEKGIVKTEKSSEVQVDE
ncbi:MAG: CoA transferase [Chloroflexi bacterium]|nr:CoA transferase [Chloroflexota bacterium]